MTMNPKARHVPAGEFKARCLALLDEVADTGAELIVTKDGQLRRWDRTRTVW